MTIFSSTLAMLLTKRHACFLAVNAALIFVNFHVWSYEPSIGPVDQGKVEPGTAHGSNNKVAEFLVPTVQAARDLAPERIPVHGTKGKPLVKPNKDVVESNDGYRFAKPESEMYKAESNLSEITPREYGARSRQAYRVPDIESTSLVNCAKLLADDADEMRKAQQTMLTRPKVPIYEETYLEWFKDCANFRRMRGYVEMPLTEVEEEYPLAFGIAMYTDVESTERLLRAIYRPNNLYCIHVDTKSSLLIHRTVRALASCFDNVWVATHLDKIKWGDVSVLLPEINCMRDLMTYYRKAKWKYFINLTGQEFPLRTNYELARIAKIFNGSNDIGGSVARMDEDRIKYKWTHRWSKTYQQTIFYNTFMPKEPAPYNLTFHKGELHGLFSRGLVQYLVESDIAKIYLQWCWDTGHPSEHYWNTLNYNRHVAAPGGYQGPARLADEYSEKQISRAKNWIGLYGNRTCHGKVVRGICVYGVKDAPWLAKRPELFANKFHLTYEYLGYDCLEELHRNRTKRRDKVQFKEAFFQNLPTVKYSRKDGLKH